jgi:phosphatidylglycerol:prolipoprotein diacylglycerol transferase
MLTYPDIDPVVVSLGPLSIHWYGLMYLVGFVAGWWLGRVRMAQPGNDWKEGEWDEALFYIALGVLLGGRIGYVLFYGFSAFLEDPLYLFRINEGGMSFHGGLLGVLIAVWLFGRRFGRTFFAITDFIAPLVPIGLGAVRVGNFINGELWGRPGDVPWAMQVPCGRFPEGCATLPPEALYTPALHPSQLYEAGLEGAVLFVILWVYSSRPRPVMAVSGLFLLCYGLFRFGVEFVRLPDAHIGYLAFDWFTMGQLLTLPMLLFGVLLMWLAYRREKGMN